MLCVAITTADQWLWSFIISRTTPYMITSLGYGTYFFFASLMVLMGFWYVFNLRLPRICGCARSQFVAETNKSSQGIFLHQGNQGCHPGRHGGHLWCSNPDGRQELRRSRRYSLGQEGHVTDNLHRALPISRAQIESGWNRRLFDRLYGYDHLEFNE